MEGTDVKANVRDEMKRSMESLCKVIDTYQNEERVILHHLQALVENAIEDKTIDVEAAPVDFFEGSVCKEVEFKVVLSWDFKDFGPVIWFDNLKKIVEGLNVSNFKLIPKNNTLELYPMSGDMARVTKLVENGKIIKLKINSLYDDPLHNGKNIYVSIVRVCKFLDIDRWYNTRQANESGIINFIKQGMEQYGIGFHDYLWSDHKQEVEFQYDRKIVRSSFYTKYKNIFEE